MINRLAIRLLILMLAAIPALRAQGTDELLTTVGTTVESGDNTYAYILWQPGEAGATLGKRFAIHSKPGAPDAPGNFTRLGIQTLQTSPNTIRALLELGARIDRAADAGLRRIDAIHRDVTLRGDAPPAAPADPSLDGAEKLSFLIQSAVTDPQLLSRLFFLGRAHPGVMQALGHAFAIRVPAGVQTYEVREVAADDSDIRVVGRVTLDPKNPVVLEAPASPFQVLHAVDPASQYPINPKDHLNARFRWGVGPALRAQMPHAFGFDLFRVKRKTAEALGWDAAPPAPAEMLAALNALDPRDPDPDISMANELPVLVGELLTPAEAADATDRERFDFADDGIWHSGAGGESVRRPFADGESFYYFVAARGITGAPGKLSPGTLVRMCDRLPPDPPSIFSVTSRFEGPGDPADWAGQGGSQFLQVKIRQLPAADKSEAAAGYYVYRWSSAQAYLDNVGNPLVNRIGGLVPHQNGRTFLEFNDNGAGAPSLATHPDQSVWYTVRAVGRSACGGEVISGHSAPVSGVLRDFQAPGGPTGDFLICRTLPTATWLGRFEPDGKEEEYPPDFRGTTVEVQRDSPAIAAARIEVAFLNEKREWLVVYARTIRYQLGNVIRVNLPYAEPTDEVSSMRIRVHAIGTNGVSSQPATAPGFNPQGGSHGVHRFAANAEEICRAVSEPGEPFHEFAGIDGSINVIEGSIGWPAGQGVAEWRVYRRVGEDGELSLIDKGEGADLPNPETWRDDAPAAGGGERVCYFGQLFDQNANPGPLVPLGCTTVVNTDLPTPMLAPVQIVDELPGRLRVRLEWFCDPAGVERFEVMAAVDGGGTPDVEGLSEVLDEAGEEISGDFSGVVFHPFQTPRVGAAMGDGPEFGMEVTVPADRRVYFAVRACGPGNYPRPAGSASNIVSARWQPEASGPQPVIPWPARELPGTFDHRRNIASYALGEGPIWPILLPNDFNVPTSFLIGVTRHRVTGSSLGADATLESPEPPETYLFKMRQNSADVSAMRDLMPFMLYRYQVPSAAFPEARANLVQCTPLIDRISWVRTENDKTKGFQIRDPFLLVLPFGGHGGFELPASGDWTDNATPLTAPPGQMPDPPPYLESGTGAILLKDPLPVIAGARYRHLLVQFDAHGEIARIIPLDPVQH